MQKHHLTWKESHHKVGIDLIDSQHQELMARINQIADEVAKGDQGESVRETLGSTIVFASEHFAFEERLMAEYGFPGIESHMEEHRRYLQLLNNLIKADPRDPGRKKMALVLAFLTDWTDHHIPHADKELGEFLAAKGLG